MGKLISLDAARDTKMDAAPFMFFVVCYVDLMRFCGQAALLMWPCWSALFLIVCAFDGPGLSLERGMTAVGVGACISLMLSPGLASILMSRFYARRRAKRGTQTPAS